MHLCNFYIIILIIFIYFTFFNKKKNIKEKFTSYGNNNKNVVPEIDNDNEIFKRYEAMKRTRETTNTKYDINYYPELTPRFLKSYKGLGNYKTIPLPINSVLLANSMDDGVLKNYRTNPFINTYSEDITFGEMNKLINTILLAQSFKLYYNNILNPDGTLKKYKMQQIIIRNTVFFINNSFKANKYNHKNHKFDKRKYKLLDYRIINDSEIKGISKENRNFIFNIKIYKEDKNNHYTLQINCNYNFITKIVNYINIDIIGIIEQEKMEFSKAYNENSDKYCNFDKNNKGKFKTCYRDDLDSKKSLKEFEKEFREKDIPDFFNQKKKEKLIHDEYLKYKCFLKKGFNESTCKAFSFENKTTGVYDKPCNVNEECPFYKKNKNYENDRGGCIKGYCEMPTNVERVGYKNYRTTTKPFCHNCNRKDCLGDDCYTCCEEQKNPDYMFSNDLNER